MTNILDQMAKAASGSGFAFRPASIQDFFALQLSRKLSDAAQVALYRRLTDDFDDSVLLKAFWQVFGTNPPDPARALLAAAQALAKRRDHAF